MIDIEGLGTSPTATIVTIAAQTFNPFAEGISDEYLKRHFYARITLESQPDRHIEDGTVEWWGTQPEAAAEAFAEDNRIDLDAALDQLYKLTWPHDFVWANGPTYDMNILEHAYRSYGKNLPWQYYKVRDARTIYSLYPDCPKPPVEHHALEDCKRQIIMLQQTFKHLGIKEIR